MYILGENASGNYFITSADDRFPAILGYGDYFSDSIPPAMKWWLSCYTEIISALLDSEAEEEYVFQSPTNEKREAIAPLLKTRWNQGEPYNLYSPSVEINGIAEKCPTGCVATAMAQVMKYHNWPQKGSGKSTYDWTDRNGRRHTFSTDFSEYVFNWDEMLESYDTTSNGDASATPNYTDSQAKAVAQLMYACGMAEKMNFDPMGSGAQTADIPHSLTEYFNYSNDVRFKMRAFSKTSEWEQTIYESLRDYGPVIYNGRDDWGGHSFVCDGYDGNGYYHFNWGWGGMSDGYFLFFQLNPSDQGIGSFEGGYNLDQNIIYNIRPAKEGESSARQPIVVQAGGNLIGENSAATYGACFLTTSNATGNLWDGFANNSSETINGVFAVRVIDNEQNATIFKGQEFTDFKPGYLYANIHADIAGLSMGEYTVYAGMILDGSEEFVPFEYPAGCRDHTKMLIGRDGSIMVSNDTQNVAAEAVVTHIDLPDEITRGKTLDLKFHMANLDSDLDYNAYTRGIIRDNKGDKAYSFLSYTSIPGGYSVKFPMTLSLPFPEGEYSLEFESADGKKISRSFNFTINDPFTESSSKGIRVCDITYVSGYEPMLCLKVSFIVPAPSDDYYDYYVKIFDGDMTYLDEYMCHSDTRFELAAPNSIYSMSYQMIESVSDLYYVKAYKRMRHTSDKEPARGEETEISKMFKIDLNDSFVPQIEEIQLLDVPETVKKNTTHRLRADIYPAEFANSRLFWTSTNENVLTVDDDGLIKAVGEGTAKIVVSSVNGKFDYCRIIVKGDNASLPESVIQDGETIEAVYSISGLKLLEKASWSDIHNLPDGIYIIRTSNGVLKLAK